MQFSEEISEQPVVSIKIQRHANKRKLGIRKEELPVYRVCGLLPAAFNLGLN